MKKLKNILSQPGIGRHFFAYFTICLIIIFIVVFSIQWSAIYWFSNRYEQEEIQTILSVIKQGVVESDDLHHEKLLLLRNIYLMNRNRIDQYERLRVEIEQSSLFYVFNEHKETVFGYEWRNFTDFIASYDILPTKFLYFDNVSVYRVSTELDVLPNGNIGNRYVYISMYRAPIIAQFDFMTIPFSWFGYSIDKQLQFAYKHLQNQTVYKEYTFLPVDSATTFGIYSQFDITGNRVLVHLYEYPREIYQFLRNTYFLIIFILIVSLLVLTIVSFAVISNKIFNPLWKLVDKMKSISKEPEQISFVDKTVRGEILQIGTFFNEMILSIKAYQSELSIAQELFEKINIGIFWLDENEKIKLCNNAFKDIFELKQTAAVNIKDLIPFEMFKHGKKLEINPFYYAKLDKELSISIHNYQHDNIIEYFGIVSDITEEIKMEKARRSLELELVRINRLSEMGRRVQSIVHNLNTPLNSVIGFAQLISDEDPKNEDIKKIIMTASSMSDIIKYLLQKTVDDSIAMPIVVNINKLLNQELMFCNHDLFFKHNVTLELNLADDIPDLNLVYGDIAQVFQTLFNNAMEAMYESKNKNLFISSFVSEGYVCFSVRDSGIGMRPEICARIFELKYSTKTMTSSGGFGIGLPLAKAIIDKLEGKIEVRSEADVGTEFIIYLPFGK
ncbi:MAG: ATP-binding protein [Candidatus Cloacimonetes bacterium]|nr:ATP-binding protein [Candidatus Cloacimonadota bacterium]